MYSVIGVAGCSAFAVMETASMPNEPGFDPESVATPVVGAAPTVVNAPEPAGCAIPELADTANASSAPGPVAWTWPTVSVVPIEVTAPEPTNATSAADPDAASPASAPTPASDTSAVLKETARALIGDAPLALAVPRPKLAPMAEVGLRHRSARFLTMSSRLDC